MFQNYPDVVGVKDVAEMLNISATSAYSLVRSKHIRCVRYGRKYLIPKKAVIGFLAGTWYNESEIVDGRLNQQSSKGEEL